LNNLLNKFTKLTTRDLELRAYDYLILNVDKKEEIEELLNFIVSNDIKIDLCFFIHDRFRKQQLYLQISSLKETKLEMIKSLKRIHNYWRIQFEKNISFKKSSKHSVFFDGKNFLIKSLNLEIELQSTLTQNIKLEDYQIFISFGDNLLSFEKFMVKDSFSYIKDEHKKL